MNSKKKKNQGTLSQNLTLRFRSTTSWWGHNSLLEVNKANNPRKKSKRGNQRKNLSRMVKLSFPNYQAYLLFRSMNSTSLRCTKNGKCLFLHRLLLKQLKTSIQIVMQTSTLMKVKKRKKIRDAYTINWSSVIMKTQKWRRHRS